MFNKLYPFRHASSGSILLNQNDVYIEGAVSAYGEFSEAEVDLFRDILEPTDYCVEVGANMGAHTLALAALCERVYCFEPQRFMFQTLCANLALNSIDNVVARQQIVGMQEGTVIIPCLDPHVEQNFGSFSLRQQYERGDYVQCTRLDSMEFPRLALLKLDCEGSELAVLEGARETLAKHRPWIYLEFAENRAEIMALLTELGYYLARHCPPINRAPNFLNKLVGLDGALASDMVLVYPRERPPRPTMEPPFGERHGFFVCKDEEVLGQPVLLQFMELYQPLGGNSE